MDRVDRTGSDEVARAPALQGLVFAPPDLGPGNGGPPNVLSIHCAGGDSNTAPQEVAQSADTAHLFQRRLGWLFHQLHCSRG